MKSTFVLLAEYNQWMNRNLFTALQDANESQVYDDRHAFFGSAFHTLSHIFTCDLMWLERLANANSRVDLADKLAQYPVPSSNLDHLFTSLDCLQIAREPLDALIVEWVTSIEESQFEQTLTYTNSGGNLFVEPFSQVLMHFFNHQTHHRGQVTTLMSQWGDSSYCTDLLALIRR
ncbi:DinB family protein [Thaumasiovibrio subtropicus]|uniref:DinB family protein n=1 Tax=Thaumasiovibrio subtropicus TaxID=1891207 RepID=UPI000B35D129|nr:DinB family protein [Thaumasiovibrio subtropicus]